MDPLLILLIGIVVVVGGILALRLNAFLALILAALVVGSLTSTTALQEFGKNRKLSENDTKKLVNQSVGERVAVEFGKTCGSIGILVAMAAIIGKCLLESGAAEKIVRTSLKILGEKNAPVAFAGTGFTLGIPVFFDTVFYLLIPLGKALASRTGRNYALYVMTITCGTTMAHSLVPPTPGPLFVANALNIQMGTMMVCGIILGLFTAGTGLAYAYWANRKWPMPMRESGTESLQEMEKMTQRSESELPGFWLALMPILLPVVLIGGEGFITDAWGKSAAGTLAAWQSGLLWFFQKFGDKNIAIALAAGIALITVVSQKRKSKKEISAGVQSALESGGLIILITAAGGAFGGVLQHTGVGERIRDLAAAYQIGILPLAFFVTALIRTAQGSATVAMITTIGMLQSMAAPETLGFHPVYLALAIGCGSKPFAWMNDSGFWVVCKMSGMTEGETLRNFSVLLTIMAVIGLVLVMIAAKLFPMI
jgi:GntP family gluconate:H+ symporter